MHHIQGERAAEGNLQHTLAAPLPILLHSHKLPGKLGAEE